MGIKKELRINPLTRLSGPLEIEVAIDERKIIDAKVKSLLFRGFELMLRDRSPLDAIYFTQRICGICSTAHSVAAAEALEDAFGIVPEKNDRMIRDFMHCAEFLQNHLRHIYQHVIPDYINGGDIYSTYEVKQSNIKIPDKISKRIAKNYYVSIEHSKVAHQIITELGGKAPHNQGMIIGGVNGTMTIDKNLRIKALLKGIKEFVFNNMFEDLMDIGKWYPECYSMGSGCGNFLSFGLLDQYDDSMRFNESFVSLDGKNYPLDENNITEEVISSWLITDKSLIYPFDKVEETYDFKKKGGYSWCRSPRYNKKPAEVGPLARCLHSGIYTRGISLMDRNIARVYELMEIVKIMERMQEEIIIQSSKTWSYKIPENAIGRGLIDTTRGALGHWIEIRDKKIYNYSIITPSAWFLSPRDQNGVKGSVEEALIGTEIEDIDNPVEIGRIVRSYDPCISCACHVTGDIEPITIRVI